MIDINRYLFTPEGIEILKDKKRMEEAVRRELSIQDIMGWSNDVVLDMYDAAVSIAKKQQWEEAEKAFLFLVTVNPFVSSFWTGYGSVAKQLSKFEEALMAYKMAILYAPENCSCYERALALALELDNDTEADAIVNLGETFLAGHLNDPDAAELQRRLPELQEIVSKASRR